VACGDLDGDRVAEIITAPGPGAMFSAHVRAWSYDGNQVIPMPGVDFLAYPSAMCGAVVTAADLNLDGVDEIITVPGPDAGWGARVLAWTVENGTVASMGDIDFDAYGDLGLTHGGKIAGGVQ
jgi:hypothetical protein